MHRIGTVLAFAVLAGACGVARAQEIYLACALVGPQKSDYRYSFTFDPGKGKLFWVEGSQEFEVFRNTSTELWASHGMKFRDFPHDSTDFRLNRVTGAAEVTYLRKPSPAEVASCKKQRSWGCEDFIVLTQHAETGSCTVVDRITGPALAAQTTTQNNGVGAGFLVGLAIAYLTRRRSIGGWLMYYYLQLYGSVLVNLIFVATSVHSLPPSVWDSSTRYVLFLLSTLPVWLLIAAEAVVGTYLLVRRRETNVRRLRLVIALMVVAAATALIIDFAYFKEAPDIVFDVLTLFFAIVWSLYFWRSKRVRKVFIERQWDWTAWETARARTPNERRYARNRALVVGVTTFIVLLLIWGLSLGDQKPTAHLFFVPAFYGIVAALLGLYLPIQQKKREALAQAPQPLP